MDSWDGNARGRFSFSPLVVRAARVDEPGDTRVLGPLSFVGGVDPATSSQEGRRLLCEATLRRERGELRTVRSAALLVGLSLVRRAGVVGANSRSD
jgi:hypothetical protein